MMMKLLALASFTLLASALLAQGETPLSTDRPGFSDGSHVVPKGTFQLELGLFRTQVGSSASGSYGDLLLRYGVGGGLELRVIGVSYGFAPGVEGWLDPSVGLKYRLYGSSKGEVTFIGQTTIPVGESALRANEFNPTFKIAATAPMGANTVGTNLVWSRIGTGSSRFDQAALSLFASRPIGPITGITGEVWAVDRISRGGPGAGYASLAISHLLTADTQIDFRLGTALNPDRDGWFFQAGYSVRF